ncbi:cyanophycin synthetase [Candidatus Kaiserbacteria bacterium]|nr:cyanophycin synthetase [Candidatus Kaiserbacteria bacterium]
MARQQKESLLLPQLLKKIAPMIGARVYIEPEWGVAGQITFRDGKKRYFRYNTLDLNSVGAADVAKDKDYANVFMKRMGYTVVPGKAFYSREWSKQIGSKRDIHAAYQYARKLGLPVIVKPNEGSHGIGVFLVRNKREFMRAMRHIFKEDRVALVQRVVRGKDYRIVILDDKVISAYERIPLSVVGDGSSSIKDLLKKKQKRFRAGGRDTRIKLDDLRIAHKLGLQKLALRSVPERGKRIYLLDNANLSSGGDAVDVTKPIHPEFKKFAIKLTRDMGLRFAGVDIMVAGDIRQKPKKYWVLEVNASPGLDHYVKTGPAQQRVVENLYLKVLKSMAK